MDIRGNGRIRLNMTNGLYSVDRSPGAQRINHGSFSCLPTLCEGKFHVSTDPEQVHFAGCSCNLGTHIFLVCEDNSRVWLTFASKGYIDATSSKNSLACQLCRDIYGFVAECQSGELVGFQRGYYADGMFGDTNHTSWRFPRLFHCLDDVRV